MRRNGSPIEPAVRTLLRHGAAALTACVLAATMAAGPALAAPPVVEIAVSATADTAADRILVRWQPVGGVIPYTHFDVLRRTADAASFAPLNAVPIGAYTSAAAIETQFTVPGRSGALADILASYGPDYASDILSIMAAATEPDRTFLPDQNYVAAIVMGLGWLDESVTAGTTYVYEVWGLDVQGFRVERLGQAIATGRQPAAIPPAVGLSCPPLGGERADRTMHLRWHGDPSAEFFFGYDIFRAPVATGDACPADVTMAPGAVKANAYPVMADAPGAARAGKVLFAAHCRSCHLPSSTNDPRLVGPACGSCTAPNQPGCNTCGVVGGTIELYRSHQAIDPATQPPGVHDTTGLTGLSPEALESIFDYIEEFQFEDDADADDTVGAPLPTDQFYCYQVLPRDLLGQHYQPVPPPVTRCQVQDTKKPKVPTLTKVERFAPQPDHEDCRVSWDRNTDDTIAYEVCAANDAIPVNTPPPTSGCATVPQPPSGARVEWEAGHPIGDAGKTFFYAVRAVDAHGNRSGLGGWGPCMPRDILPPAPPVLTMQCCDNGRPCDDRRFDPDWGVIGESGQPGLPALFASAGSCAALTCAGSADVFRCRMYRTVDGDTAAWTDVAPGQAVNTDFQPGLDTSIEITAVAIDASGNMSPPSSGMATIFEGKSVLPAPRIVSASLRGTAGGIQAGRVRLRFRSLPPEQILGFAIYEQYAGPGDPDPAPPAATDRVFFFPATSLEPYSTYPPQWKVLASAQPLAATPGLLWTHGSFPEPDTTPYLIFETDTKVYQMQADFGKTGDIVFRIGVIGWSGKESKSVPFRWGGWDAGDLTLQWPEFRADNAAAATPASGTLTAHAESGFIEMTWPAFPDACNGPIGARPFIVFRRRGAAPGWQQISTPFYCDGPANPNMLFQDTDVEPGIYYTYVVVRLDTVGEFDHQVGPTTLCFGTCTGAPPQ